MDLNISRNRWRKRSQKSKPLLLIFIFVAIAFLLFASSTSKPFKPVLPFSQTPQCAVESPDLSGKRFLWYAPHSGFSNQLSELKNAILIAGILNRTLIMPPVLDHHAVALGSCPKFRVVSPSELRAKVWDHIMELIRDRRYVSMADIVDLSSISYSSVQTIDFRVFTSVWCGLNMDNSCHGELCCSMTNHGSSLGSFNQCRSLLSGLQGSIDGCTYAVEDDCRTTVWTYQQNNDGLLDSFQPDKELQRKKNISYVRKRRDVYKALGSGSKAETATILVFGTVFSGPYKGSELYIDIHEAPSDSRIQSLHNKIKHLPFTPEITDAGKEFAINKIKVPFLCAQLRLLDGQFKNHWKTTFSDLEQKIKSVRLEAESKLTSPLHMFIMTDLPRSNWTGTYLADLAENSNSYKLYTLNEADEIVEQTAKRLMKAEHAMRSSFRLKSNSETLKNRHCDAGRLPDILLFIEKTICSCASLGFVGTTGSTIAESIELMRQHNVCKH
ncbi:O-fucosyltransferase 30 [Dioscorea cayenensis subsp. rotundata]|uniref:O-fucosyltransferase 30 n=1 Tax=Dioscorea cayennensis subsp. rotundata TaxID=55577 RepID=A0AB40CRD4_DIOCR|nr:O-fucosyltransferase 30 [Dioscorea cayenensis subsp. rotundata]